MSGNEDFEKFLEEDDDFPQPSSSMADHLFRDKYGIVWHCILTEEHGWAWTQLGDAHE